MLKRGVRYIDVECVDAYGGSYNAPEIRELLQEINQNELAALKKYAKEYLKNRSFRALDEIHRFFLKKNNSEVSYVLKENTGHGIRFVCEEILAV